MATLNQLYDRLDADSNARGRQFERITKWYLENAPEYRHALRRVWLWDDWPGRWGADAGIDLVAEDTFGNLWSMQAKANGPPSVADPASGTPIIARLASTN